MYFILNHMFNYGTRDTNVKWDDIGKILVGFLNFFLVVGLNNAKKSLQEIVVYPALNPDV